MQEMFDDTVGYIYKHGKMWYIQVAFFKNGQKTSTTQKSTKVLVSEKPKSYMDKVYLPAKIAEMKLQTKTKTMQSSNHSLKYYHDMYVSNKSHLITYKRTLSRSRSVLEYFGANRDIREINRFMVKQYAKYLVNQNISRDTIKSYLNQLGGILTLAMDNEIISKNPTDKVSPDKKSVKNPISTKSFSPNEVKLLLENATDDLKNYLGIAFNTGLSPEELIALKFDDIDYLAKKIHVRRVITKGNLRENDAKNAYRLRSIPLFKSCIPFIEAQMILADGRGSKFLFSNEDGSRLNDSTDIRGKSKNTHKWHALISKCGLEYRPLKNCRHTWAVQAIKSKKYTLQEIAKILGHANLRMLIHHYAADIDTASEEAKDEIDVYDIQEVRTVK
jgi:integrase